MHKTHLKHIRKELFRYLTSSGSFRIPIAFFIAGSSKVKGN